LLVLSHVDADHIQGVVALLSRHDGVARFRDVWFNGWKHLPALAILGAPDGERMSRLLDTHSGCWNGAFDGGPVVVPDTGTLRPVELDGGLELTLLSPTSQALATLAPKWQRECAAAGLIPGRGAPVPKVLRRADILGWNIDVLARAPYRPDRAEANGSSIAFVAAYRGQRVLCAADAHAETLAQSLDRLGPGPHTFAAVKLSHHGSARNLSPGLLSRIHSRNWLVSTNGARFQHPDPETLARIITTQPKPTFHLNYVTTHVQDLINGAGHRYSVKLPKTRRDGAFECGIVVKLA
jgi:hypothetical protein